MALVKVKGKVRRMSKSEHLDWLIETSKSIFSPKLRDGSKDTLTRHPPTRVDKDMDRLRTSRPWDRDYCNYGRKGKCKLKVTNSKGE